MRPEKYFEKNGEIYGISEKKFFGEWEGYAVRFTNYEEALEWLKTEEYDFRIRELVSKTRAKEYM